MRIPLLLAACAVTAAAQAVESHEGQLEFSADRPGFTTSPTVLPRGVLQLEGGFLFSVERTGATRRQSAAFGNPLARVGVGHRIELRVSSDGLRTERLKATGVRLVGRSDTVVGAKIGVTAERKFRPAISLLPALSIPSGHAVFTSSTYDPSLGVAWSKGLAAGLSLGGTFTSRAISDGGARMRQFSSAVVLGFALPRGTGGYVEMFETTCAGGSRARVASGGLTRAFGGNVQIDAHAGRTIDTVPPSWFAAAGFAIRYAPR
jgi:hypothetical protein